MSPKAGLCEETGDRQHQDSRYWLDSSAIKRDVGWEPQIGWQEGMREMVQWDRKYLPSSRSCDAGLTVAGVARGRIAPERFSAPHDPLVAALLQLLDGRYLMKLPDCSPDIFYPDHRGCVDGAVDAGEAPAVALVRELHEELMVTLIRPT